MKKEEGIQHNPLMKFSCPNPVDINKSCEIINELVQDNVSLDCDFVSFT